MWFLLVIAYILKMIFDTWKITDVNGKISASIKILDTGELYNITPPLSKYTDAASMCVS